MSLKTEAVRCPETLVQAYQTTAPCHILGYRSRENIWFYLVTSGKAKFTLEQASKTQRGSRGVALLLL